MTEDRAPGPAELPPPSPCVAVCIVHPKSGLCMGCFRTAEEITEWPTASAVRKQEIVAALGDREQEELRGGS